MSQASGWYDDPDDPDYLRYHDGVAWTEHRAPRRAPQVDRSRTETPEQPAVERIDGPPPGSGQSPYVVRPGQQAGGSGTYPSPPSYPAPPGQPWGQAPVQGQPWPQTTGRTTDDGQPLASWGRRLLGYLVDGFLTALVLGPIMYPLIGDWAAQLQGWGQEVEPLLQAGQTENLPEMPLPSTETMVRASLVMFLGYLLYEVGCLARWGRTPGKALAGISVRAAEAPVTAPVGRLLARALVKRLDLVLPGALSLLMLVFWPVNFVVLPLVDRRRQAVHDKAGRTVVVQGRVARRGGTEAQDPHRL